MLSKKYLLNKKEVFLLKREGKVVDKNPFFNTIAFRIPEESVSKFTFIISKKVSRKAVERNKVKRVMAEAIRVNIDKFDKGYYIGFYLKEKATDKSYEELFDLVNKEISKISIF